MDIKELRSLAVLARTGNITRSAEALYLTPSAIHRHLQILNEELDLELYEKEGKSLRLTSEGKSLLPLIEELLLQFESVQAAAADLKQLKRGSVRVASGPTFSSYVLPRLLEAFRSRHPSIDIFLEAGHTSQLMAELEDGSLDVVFLVLRPGTEKKFAVEALWKFEVSFVTSPRLAPSGVTSKPAIRGHFKTGHRKPTQNTSSIPCRRWFRQAVLSGGRPPALASR